MKVTGPQPDVLSLSFWSGVVSSFLRQVDYLLGFGLTSYIKTLPF